MRFSFKRITVSITYCLIVCLFYVYAHLFLVDKYTDKYFKKTDLKIKRQVHHANYQYKSLTSFLSQHPDLSRKPIDEKCQLFFKDFISQNPDWRFPEFMDNKYNKAIDNLKDYFTNKINSIIEKRTKAGGPAKVTLDEKKSIEHDYLQTVKTTMDIDHQMADSISLLRLYGKCFLDNAINIQNDQNQKLFNTMTEKLFSFVRFKMPTFEIYTSANESIKFNNGLPDYSLGDFSGKVHQPTENQNIIQFYQESVNGKGIVLSATPKHARDISKLIRVLRALNNDLPIQIVTRAALTDFATKLILKAAHETLEEAIADSNEFDQILPELDLIELSKKFHCYYPKQKIIFSNIKPLTRERKLFTGYNNKLLAFVFSSFREVLLMDADTVPLVEVEKLFQSEEYKSTATMFFKDRSLRDTNDYMETNFFQKLFPLNQDSLENHFDIPILDKNSDIIKNNNFLRGYRHYQEAGIVAFDKSAHFLSTLMVLPLGVWKDPVKSSVWGDKEFYWLGLLMAGDDNFMFNKYEAASVGQETPEAYKMYTNTPSKEVCSSHPGHIDQHGELLWINSGFTFCKKNGSFRDRARYPYNKYSAEDLRSMYENPLRITHAIVPPSLPSLRIVNDEMNHSAEKKMKKSWKLRKADVDEVPDYEKTGIFGPTIDYNPQKGWIKTSKCTGYYYCAYDQIDSYDAEEELDVGASFSFDESQSAKYDFLGKLWAGGSVKLTANKKALKEKNKNVKPTKA